MNRDDKYKKQMLYKYICFLPFILHDKMLFLLIFIRMQCPLNPREHVNCGNFRSEYRSDPYPPVRL